MPSVDIERRVAAYYAGKLREHGATHRGVDWNSPESHALRHEQFLPVIPAGEHVSVLDYGCGYGAFGEFLAAAGRDVRYTGYDVAPEMVAAARERHPGLWFTSERAALEPADVTVASGIFNVRAGTEAARW